MLMLANLLHFFNNVITYEWISKEKWIKEPISEEKQRKGQGKNRTIQASCI